MYASLRIRSTLPLQFAAKYVENFELERFVKELLAALLRKPSRYDTLRALDRLFRLPEEAAEGGADLSGAVDFRALLSAAVEMQGRSETHWL